MIDRSKEKKTTIIGLIQRITWPTNKNFGSSSHSKTDREYMSSAEN